MVEDYGQWFLGRLRVLADTLEREPFVAAQRFTMADISIGYADRPGMPIVVTSSSEFTWGS